MTCTNCPTYQTSVNDDGSITIRFVGIKLDNLEAHGRMCLRRFRNLKVATEVGIGITPTLELLQELFYTAGMKIEKIACNEGNVVLYLYDGVSWDSIAEEVTGDISRFERWGELRQEAIAEDAMAAA